MECIPSTNIRGGQEALEEIVKHIKGTGRLCYEHYQPSTNPKHIRIFLENGARINSIDFDELPKNSQSKLIRNASGKLYLEVLYGEYRLVVDFEK